MDLSPGLTSLKLCLDIEAALISFIFWVTPLWSPTGRLLCGAVYSSPRESSKRGEAKDASRASHGCSVFNLPQIVWLKHIRLCESSWLCLCAFPPLSYGHLGGWEGAVFLWFWHFSREWCMEHFSCTFWPFVLLLWRNGHPGPRPISVKLSLLLSPCCYLFIKYMLC